VVLDDHQPHAFHRVQFIRSGDDTAETRLFDEVMEQSAMPRVLLAVSPRVLRDTLARVLRELATDEVCVQRRDGTHFDVAIVSSPSEGLDADVVIVLPTADLETRTAATIMLGEDAHPYTIDGLPALMRVLDEYVPVQRSRADALLEAN
jgi:hypothetical protein